MKPGPVPVLAGFECGHLGWNGHDLLTSTRHLPADRMAAHYAIARRHGLSRARDGLPWRHDPVARIRTAHAAGVEVVWDMSHFDPPPDPVAHAKRIATGADASTPLWICPVNEPSLYPRLCGMPEHDAVRLAVEMSQDGRRGGAACGREAARGHRKGDADRAAPGDLFATTCIARKLFMILVSTRYIVYYLHTGSY